ncbi:MAG: ABC transporter permease [Candidatus Solibacter usitatus]|nr:ABC transporter permease [Candidatus Solibacter usitatus]
MMTGLRYSLRALARTPVLSLVVVLSLGLGIGANTAILSLLHQIVLRSLPVQRPEQLVALHSPGDLKSGRSATNNAGGMDAIFSYPVFRALEKEPRALAGIAGYRLLGANIAFQGKTLNGGVLVVSGGYFPLLGVHPLLGRMLAPADDAGSGQPVVVLSYGYWNDRLGGRADVLNQPMRVNGQMFTVVGVAPRSFTGMTFGDEPDLFVPMVFKPAMTPGWDGRNQYDDYWIYVFGRLKDGATMQQAEDSLNSLYGGLKDEELKAVRDRPGDFERRFRASKLTLREAAAGQSAVRESMKTPLTVLMICTALVLLIAAANAANLLLARGAQRGRELSIRVAMGASRGRIVRQLLTEAMLLACGGGLAGVLLGSWALDLLMAGMQNGESQSYTLSASLDGTVLAFASVVALATGLLFGLYPAWAGARESVSTTLKEDSGNASSSRSGVRARRALVTAQVAISLLLLIPMGLFLKSLVNLLRVDLGIRTENLLTFHLSPELNGYKVVRSVALFERAERELAAIPGVTGVTTAMVPLISGSNWGNSLRVEGFSTDPKADRQSMFNAVGAGFLREMGVPLISGREFRESDTAASPKVALVNETFVRHFFAGKSPIGRHLRVPVTESSPEIEIVGVVKDSKYSGVRQQTPRLYYLPYRQVPKAGVMSFYVRAALKPEQITAQIRRVMAGIDPDLPLENLRTLEEQVARNIRSDRLVLQMASAFAILATALAMMGLYGVMAFGVSRRTREIGIRMAMGADAGGIGKLVLREVLLILAIGAGVGTPAALGLAKLAESQLFGVKAYDVTVVLAALAALAGAALLAGYMPARHAMRVNPVEALRYE